MFLVLWVGREERRKRARESGVRGPVRFCLVPFGGLAGWRGRKSPEESQRWKMEAAATAVKVKRTQSLEEAAAVVRIAPVSVIRP